MKLTLFACGERRSKSVVIANMTEKNVVNVDEYDD
jgi:hypothetical protein